MIIIEIIIILILWTICRIASEADDEMERDEREDDETEKQCCAICNFNFVDLGSAKCEAYEHL